MLIKVTQEHIYSGRQHSSGNCPVAKACQQATGRDLYVGHVSIFDPSSINSCIPLPDKVRKRISDFDITGQMEPFEFELEISSAN